MRTLLYINLKDWNSGEDKWELHEYLPLESGLSDVYVSLETNMKLTVDYECTSKVWNESILVDSLVPVKSMTDHKL